MLTKEELATIRLPEGCDWVRPNGVGKWFTHYPYTHGQTDRAISAVAEAEANGHLPRGATAAIWAMVETGKVPVATTHVQCSRKFGQSAASATGTR